MIKYSLVFSLIFVSLSLNTAQATDFGVRGEVFPILEQDMMDHLKFKLGELKQSGGIQKLEEDYKAFAAQKIKMPNPVQGVSRALVDRTFFYDPSFVVPQDLRDQRGKVFHRKGERVNPLTLFSMTADMLFIDARDQDQLVFLENKLKASEKVKIILVGGSPETTQSHLADQGFEQNVYFDQKGLLTKKLGLKHVPAVVKQEGLALRVNEIKLTKES